MQAANFSLSGVWMIAIWTADSASTQSTYFRRQCGSSRARDGRSDSPHLSESRGSISIGVAHGTRYVRPVGIASTATDKRGWLRHNSWPEAVFPLRRNVDGKLQYPSKSEPYPFVQVEGDGVHEIAVGPVHAGTIEPGHFRFSVVGEKVLRLEERLGYTHKGIAKRFEQMYQSEAYRLAARVFGD